MAKLTRHFTLPNDLLKLYEGLIVSRSVGMALAIDEAKKQPQQLVKALSRRVGQNSKTGSGSENVASSLASDVGAKKVTLYVDEKTLDDVAYLEKVSGLPKEIVIRLAMEAYVHKL